VRIRVIVVGILLVLVARSPFSRPDGGAVIRRLLDELDVVLGADHR
jgi:hypothetical protein